MLIRLAPLGLLLSLVSSVQAGTFEKPVINLDARSFDREVLSEDVSSPHSPPLREQPLTSPFASTHRSLESLNGRILRSLVRPTC